MMTLPCLKARRQPARRRTQLLGIKRESLADGGLGDPRSSNTMLLAIYEIHRSSFGKCNECRASFHRAEPPSFQGTFRRRPSSCDLASVDSEGLGGLRAVVHSEAWPHPSTILCTLVEALVQIPFQGSYKSYNPRSLPWRFRGTLRTQFRNCGHPYVLTTDVKGVRIRKLLW